MLSKNSSVSRWKAFRRLSSKSGNRFTTGSLVFSDRTFSHWPVKLVISASDFGSASMRRTCFSSTAGSLSLPCAARSISSSSGMLLHRKKDSREASARSLTR